MQVSADVLRLTTSLHGTKVAVATPGHAHRAAAMLLRYSSLARGEALTSAENVEARFFSDVYALCRVELFAQLVTDRALADRTTVRVHTCSIFAEIFRLCALVDV